MRVPADELGPEDLGRLSSVVTRRTGMAFGEGRWPFLRTRVREAMARAGFTSGREWIEEIEASASAGGALYEDLEQALHIHETRFFRYAHHHRLLRETVMPELLAAGGTRLRVLSVGCSTGEEPYSVAMTMLEARRPADVEIVAVDISREALDSALAARYPASVVGDVPEGYAERYFTTIARDTVRVARDVRALVRFFQHDIRRETYLGKFDAIFCCNVLLYFTAAVKERVVARLGGALKRGAFLFLGHAEGVIPDPAHFRSRHLPAGIVHQRL